MTESHLATDTKGNSIPIASTSTAFTYQQRVTPDAAKSTSAAPSEVEPESEQKRTVGHFCIGVGQTLSGLSKAALEAQFDDFVSLGIGWVRIDIDWSEVQPYDSGHYNWRNIDRIVTAANAHDIRLLATVSYTPPWARGAECYSSKCASADPWRFPFFVKEVVHISSPLV